MNKPAINPRMPGRMPKKNLSTNRPAMAKSPIMKMVRSILGSPKRGLISLRAGRNPVSPRDGLGQRHVGQRISYAASAFRTVGTSGDGDEGFGHAIPLGHLVAGELPQPV